MDERILCPVKINITLRVLLPKPDGYHGIYSVFWKKNGIEWLTISLNNNKNMEDVLEVKGLKIYGPNLLTKTLSWARRQGADVPPLSMCIEKHFPVRSGIGAGSGNAAALISWIRANYDLKADCNSISQIGADVSFLTLGCNVALAQGVGEILTPLEDIPGHIWVIAFPKWKSSTTGAYTKLDKYREANGISVSMEGLESESFQILQKLRNKECVGLLPNDFLAPLSEEHHEYNRAFDLAEKAGAIAWGLCGSGSALFVICLDNPTADIIKLLYEQESWITKITKLE